MFKVKWVEAKGGDQSHAVHVYKAGGGEAAMVLMIRQTREEPIDTTWQPVPVELSHRTVIDEPHQKHPGDKFFQSIGPGPMVPTNPVVSTKVADEWMAAHEDHCQHCGFVVDESKGGVFDQKGSFCGHCDR